MNTQPEALRLADELEMWTRGEPAAEELRRLHEVNQELVEALVECERYGGGYTNCEESYLPPFVRDKIQIALAKAKGEV
jgi:hypothetical protein